jgi:hypothetical protein
MPDSNGQGQTRLDRIEEMIERHVMANEAAHDAFRAEHKLLLTAQVVFQENLNKLENNLNRLDLKMLETTEKLDALIQTVDEWIRRQPAS